MDTCFFFQAFEVKIQTVQIIFFYIRDQAVDQFSPCGSRRQQRLCLNICAEIINQCPHLKSFCMGFRHIIFARKRLVISIIIRQGKPCRGDHVHSFCLCHNAVKAIISILGRHLMPSENDLPTHTGTLVYRCFKIPGKFLTFHIRQSLILYIPDISVRGCDPRPFFHRIDDRHCIIPAKIRYDLALDPAFYPQTGIFLHAGYVSRPPVIDQDSFSITGIKSLDLHIRVVRDQTESQVDFFILHKKQRRTIGALCLRIGIDNLIRQCIYKKIFYTVPVKTLIDMVIYPRDRQVSLTVFIDSCLLLLFIIINDRRLIPGYMINFRKICPLFRRHIPLQYPESDKAGCDQDDQTDSGQYRNYFFHLSSLFPHAILQRSASVSASLRIHAESLFYYG